MGSLKETCLRIAATGSIIAFSSFGNISCAPATDQKQGIENSSSLESQSANQFLLQAIDELQPSPIKDMLSNRVSPFLRQSAPQSLDLSGVNIPVQNLRVAFQTKDKLKGVTTRGSFSALPIVNYPIARTTEERKIYVPYIGLHKPDDKVDYYKTPDGTYYISLNIPAGSEITSGISPEISVETFSGTKTGITEQNQFENEKKIVGVKESIQFALVQVMEEMMINGMRNINQDTSIEVISNNITSSMELISGTVTSITKYQGRFLAAMDAAATVVMIKAYPPEEIKQILDTDKLSKVAIALENVDLGDNEKSILLNALQWVINNPLGETIPHAGDFNKIP